MGDEKGNGMLGCIWFVSATQERKEEKALKTEIRKMCICILTIYMYCSVSNIPTISHREGKYKETHVQPPASPLCHNTQVLKTNSPPSFLCFNWTTPAELLSDSRLKHDSKKFIICCQKNVFCFLKLTSKLQRFSLFYMPCINV